MRNTILFPYCGMLYFYNQYFGWLFVPLGKQNTFQIIMLLYGCHCLSEEVKILDPWRVILIFIAF